MKRLRAGIVIGAVAAVVLPGVAAAQCEGGVSTAGFYLSNGAYVPGGCSYTNPTTTGQLYPSGAQVVPSTNPAAGTTRLPGQRVPASPLPTILDTVTGSYGPLGPFTSAGAYTTTAGPGARLGGYPGEGLLPNTGGPGGATRNTLVNQMAPGSFVGNATSAVAPATTVDVAGAVPNAAAAIPETFDPLPAQPNTTGLSAGNTAATPTDTGVGTVGLPGAGAPSVNQALGQTPNEAGGSALTTGGASVVAPATTNGVTTTSTVGVNGTANVNVGALGTGTTPNTLTTTSGLGVGAALPGMNGSNPSPAYSVSLPMAPTISQQDYVVPNPVRVNVPPPPGRGGPTVLGQDTPPVGAGQ